jgi:fructosamine-3-kinase
MVSSEYIGAQALHNAYPELVPEPIAWGTYKQEHEVYFLLVRFYDLSGDIPHVSVFPSLLAKVQTRPEAKSKTGEFGFPIVTYGGRNPSVFPMSKSWEATLTGCLEAAFIAEEQTHGPDAEMTRLRDALFLKVLPRLVRPLETEGRHIDPVLCHGDLWDGNVSVDTATGDPKTFDPTPLYAHKECRFREEHHASVIKIHKLTSFLARRFSPVVHCTPQDD